MDALTHLFLPLTVAYVLSPDLIVDTRMFALGVLGPLPDADKLFGIQGAFHSLTLIGLVGAALLTMEYHVRGKLRHAPIAAALLGSHLLLDLLDGGPVFLLLPTLGTGVGLTFPTTISLGASLTDIGISQPLPTLQTGKTPNRGARTYSLVTGYGACHRKRHMQGCRAWELCPTTPKPCKT